MAATSEAVALSDDHRRRQAQLAAYMVGQLGQLWPMLDPTRIDETRGPWLKAVTSLVAQGYTASATLTAAFLPALRGLERIPGVAPKVPLGTPDLARIIAAQAFLGPIRIKTRIAEGMDPAESIRIGRDQTLAVGQQHTLDGGRDQTLTTVRHDRRALGWCRTPAVSACAFCQMLASRPHYKSKRSASFQAHPGCNCGAEPIYSRDESTWPPRTRVLAEEWQTVTKGLEGADARLAWRRHVDGYAGALDDAGTAAAADARTAGRMAPTRDTTSTATGRGAALPRPAAATTKSGRGRQLTRRPLADLTDPAQRAAFDEQQVAVLTANLAKLKARAAAGEDVAKAVEWTEQRVGQLRQAIGPEASARATDAAKELAAGQAERTAAGAARRAAAADRYDKRAATLEQHAADTVDAEATKAAEDLAAEADAYAAEAEAVAGEEAASAAEETRAAAGAELDDNGRPWRLSNGYLDDLDEDALDELVGELADRIADGNPRELERWDDLDLYVTYRDRYNAIVEQAGHVPDDQITAELAALQRDHGRAGLTHDAAEEAATSDAAASRAGRPTKREVLDDYALYVEELYVRAEAYCRTHMLNAKGQAKRISGKSLMTGDVRRVYRYASPELLEFFETEGRRYQFAEFYAERTGSSGYAQLAARQQRLNAGINRDRTALDLVTNREA